ncbi:cupin domain-containing protein [Pelagicoccus sp. SDUM812003]|uniref:cupin domain-containing protein n=1 Tax=Pelagicoccus sp. SDUM812003 TaxID=3041267 RepID=UPI00280CEC0E|nr:cupin domain-containing protein [Pelagicoccus sp. SDUM812003]MDQ8201416.1 cupin domain-containing protein [Pelagicoccus sp. SDUM812003]
MDFPGWKGLSLEDVGLLFFLFDIEAGAAEFPLHASEDEWLAYVIEGGGELYSGFGDTKKTGSVRFAEGDFITFHSNTSHAWKNGQQRTRILFARKA